MWVEGDDEAGMRRWSPRSVVVAAIAATVAIATLIALLISATRQRDEALAFQRDSYETMILAGDLNTALASAEAALGRYVISADKGAGTLYSDYWLRSASLIEKVEDSAVESAEQTAALARLRDAFTARGNELGGVALRTTYGQNPQALSKYYTAGKSPTLGALRDAVAAITAIQRADLERRTSIAESRVKRATVIGSVIAAAGVIFLGGAAIFGWNAVAARAERRKEAERSALLDAAVDERTRELTDANQRLVEEMGERQAAEERLRQGQKLEAIGQLTGGIAHDFNNMLSVVIGGIELAARRLGDRAPEAKGHLVNALDGANRAATLTRRLLAFARAEPLVPEATDTARLVGDMAEMIDRTLGDTIAVSIDARARWPVFVDKHQLENAILNLTVNARDAMERGGGTLEIATADLKVADGALGELPGGDYVCISVTDTGIGMTPEVQARIFEPFFTTKPADKGTGLGLSQIFGFVRNSHGAIEVRSTPGQGTMVALYLPRHDGVPVREASTTLTEIETRGGQRILVIEDDPRVLAQTVAAVRELGHEPIACNRPADVPAILRERRDISMVLSDVAMPGVSGPELVAAIHLMHPDMPAMFVTGFAGALDDPKAFGDHLVLRKPFTLTGLAAAIDRTMGRDPPARAA